MAVAIQWRRLDTSGSESALLDETTKGWLLTGCAVFLNDRHPCGLTYAIECAKDWHTMSANIAGHIGTKYCNYQIDVKGGCWRMNGKDCPQVNGCIDIDIGFSPSTNLLPIKRKPLVEGESMEVKAAWLQFPGMELTPLTQIYTRETDNQFRYESLESGFTCTIEINQDGLVTSYPGFWHEEAAT